MKNVFSIFSMLLLLFICANIEFSYLYSMNDNIEKKLEELEKKVSGFKTYDAHTIEDFLNNELTTITLNDNIVNDEGPGTLKTIFHLLSSKGKKISNLLLKY